MKLMCLKNSCTTNINYPENYYTFIIFSKYYTTALLLQYVLVVINVFSYNFFSSSRTFL